jgi:hypothetical protein
MVVYAMIMDVAPRERGGTRGEVDVYQVVVLHGH